jgi:hypothetical protein
MKTLRTQDGKFLAPLTRANGHEPEALLARERIGLFASQPQGSQEMNLDDFLAGMHALGTEIKSQLVSMDEGPDKFPERDPSLPQVRLGWVQEISNPRFLCRTERRSKYALKPVKNDRQN